MRRCLVLSLLVWALPLAAQAPAEPKNSSEPKIAAEPAGFLPDPQALLARIIARAERVNELAEAYCYREVETEETLDRRGNPKKTTVSAYEVTRLTRGQVRRLVAENGQPLSPERAKAEDDRVQAALKELLEPPSEVGDAKKGFEIRITPQDLLAVTEVGPLSRTTYKGQPVLALAFWPRKDVSLKGLGQRLAGRIEGRLLVDESTEQVVLAEGRLLESFWVGGGILGAVAPPSSFEFEQQRVAEGLWLPLRGTFSFTARVTFVPFRRRMRFECSDFKRFVVEAPLLSRAS